MSKYKVNYKKTCKTREYEYGDFRDWFFMKEDIPKPHEIPLYILINQDEKIDCGLIPINFKAIEIDLTLIIIESFLIESAILLIPEMGLKSKDTLSNYIQVNSGDTLKMTFNFNMNHEEI